MKVEACNPHASNYQYLIQCSRFCVFVMGCTLKERQAEQKVLQILLHTLYKNLRSTDCVRVSGAHNQ